MTTKEEFMEYAKGIMRDADKLKRVMVKKGLYKAKAKCPMCEGYLIGVRSHYNGHLHMKCTGSCKRSMVE